MAFIFKLLPGRRAEALSSVQKGPALVRHLSLFDWKFWDWGRQEQTSDDRNVIKPRQGKANVKQTGEKGSSKLASARVGRPASAANKQLSLESRMPRLGEVHPGAEGQVVAEVVVTSTEHGKQCAMCLQLRSQRDFRKLRSSPDGVHYLCLPQVYQAQKHLTAVVPKGQAYCPSCGETKDKTLFEQEPRSRSGLRRFCRACIAEDYSKRPHVQGRANKERPIIAGEGATVTVTRRADGTWVPSKKVCHACGKLKVAGDYYTEAAKFDGLNSYCKKCFCEKYLQRRR